MNARIGLLVLSLALSITIGLVVAQGRTPASATVEPGSSANAVLIGLSLDTLKEARWQRDRDLMLARAHSQGAEVLVQSANSDDARQIADIQALLTRRVNVLVIVPHDGTAMAKAVAMAHDVGVPVIAYDRIIRDSDVDLYVSFDNVRVGELQAKYVVEHLPTPGKGRIVRIYGSKADNNAKLFKEGQDDVLRPYIDRQDIKVIHEDWADDWKPENAKKIVNAAISEHGTAFDAILASNDGTAGGAIQALSEEGLAGKMLVTGQDAELVACQRIVAGTQAMTVYKPLERLADSAIDLAVRMARGRVVVARQSVYNGKIDVPAVLADVVVTTRDNMMDTVIRDGFLSRQDVYGGPR
jgi:D-xylose transport system substrate-binding protein